MRYNTPQFIDIEDHIVGPLTGKQVLWMFAMAGAIFLLWMTISNKAIFMIAALVVGISFVALAFYRPYGQPLTKLIYSFSFFIMKPKVYTWRRDTSIKSWKNKQLKKNRVYSKIKKEVKREDIVNLAELLDSEEDIIKSDFRG